MSATVAATGTMPTTRLAEFTLLPAAHPADAAQQAPACFHDLNLDQLAVDLARRAPHHDVMSALYAPPGTLETVQYRQAVARDLAREPWRRYLTRFTGGLDWVEMLLRGARERSYLVHQQQTVLQAAVYYTQTVAQLRDDLAADPAASAGLRAAAAWLDGYTASSEFQELRRAATQITATLARLVYRIRIAGSTIEVSEPRDEPDYAAAVLATFDRFAADQAGERHSVEAPRRAMNHVEAQIVSMVARLHPEEFGALAAFVDRYRGFVHPQITRFDAELRFYLSYLDLLETAHAAGLPSCFPALTTSRGTGVQVVDGYDLVLALRRDGIVPNDLAVAGDERLVIVTGPNQGGKTTFARTLGQLCYLASLGLPVPARHAALPLVDEVHTHFPRAEQVEDLRGGLMGELVRVRDTLQAATPASLVVVNEILSSTSLADALDLSTTVLQQLDELGCLVVWVTFLDELVNASLHTVSYVSQVAPDDPSVRTFRVLRQPPDGLAHALALARKHHLSRDDLARRLP